MTQTIQSPARVQSTSGWLFTALLALGFAGLFLLNYLLPLREGSYTTRVWEWAQLALAAGALLVVGVKRRSIGWKTALTGAALGLVSGLSRGLHDASVARGLVEAAATWLAFAAGAALLGALSPNRVPAFQSGREALRNIGLGLLLALPLAAVNNLFFFLQNGAPRFQNGFLSAVEALSPAIHEEAIYRYFILAVVLTWLKDSPRPKTALTAAIVLAVVPHSLLHLPDLFLQNPLMGVGMLAATSLLFGLPMALLQVKRGFESAVAFHWFIDFLRFFFGY